MTERSPGTGPRDAEVTDLSERRRRRDPGARLSTASAASVRDAAIAVLSRGVRYLPVVEDGTLVGLVALAEAPQPAASVRPTGSGRRRRRNLDFRVQS